MSNRSQVLDRVRPLAQEVAQREGCRLYDLEFISSKGRTLRVYIDKEVDSVSLDDCAAVSNGLNLLLDVEDAIPGGEYALEVSSPGLERPLREDWHFTSAIGQKVFLRAKSDLAQGAQGAEKSRRKVIGELKSLIDNNVVVVDDGGHEYKVSLENVDRAHVVFDFKNSKKDQRV